MSPETELRDRVIRLEQDAKNQKETFAIFRTDDFGALKREVHTMRSEINEKIDKLLETIGEMKDKQDERWNAMSVRMAYYLGGFAALSIVGKFVADKFF